uniref:RNA-dependent RNA polymerase n=1 Tax=Erysiphe necator associated polymycovirus 5 TaxID=2742559 RepID=A0A8E3YZQ2_9VIRU|nr:RNA-dependent RNA polymerase [Erysiphe necator associated polymycovirus 5]
MSQATVYLLDAASVATPIPRPISPHPPTRQIVELHVNHCLHMFARHTAEQRDVEATIPGVDGKRDGKITVHHIITENKFVTNFRTTRANLIRLEGTEEEKLRSLAFLDTPPEAETKKTRLDRKAQRLEDAVKLASKLEKPSFRIYPLQRRNPLGFGAQTPKPDRPLRPHALVAINMLAKVGGTVDEAYKASMMEAYELGDHTTHDPDTLHPRFLEYVHERITEVPRREEISLAWARKVLTRIWRIKGISAKALGRDDMTVEAVAARMKSGSPGEYAEKGMLSRTNPKMIRLMSRSLERYYVVGQNMSVGRKMAPWVHFTQQPTVSFGKTELKPAKIDGDGNTVKPVPRFIFNVSPINYALASFLHGDISHKLQESDPTHGPGFGPARGKAGKFVDKVMKHLVPSGAAKLTHRAIMSDISKWDANMSEVLIEAAFSTMESAVDTSHLDPDDVNTRRAMLLVARRQLMKKVVEHPSGYFVELYGCMPSGSFYTSVLNTVANDLLALSLLGAQLLERGVSLDDKVNLVAEAAIDSLVSYGDNQLIFESLFASCGIEYSVQRHAEHLKIFGMRLKVDETDVSERLDHVRFCSRGTVLTPKGLAVTRSHTSVFAKLGGRPTDEPYLNKLYVRALMVDLVGTDPIIHAGLAKVDSGIIIDPTSRISREKIGKTVAQFAARMFDGDEDMAVRAFGQLLQTRGPPDRRTLVSLARSRCDAEAVLKFGTSLTLGDPSVGTPDEVGEWLVAQTPQTYKAYLLETDQLGTLYGN